MHCEKSDQTHWNIGSQSHLALAIVYLQRFTDNGIQPSGWIPYKSGHVYFVTVDLVCNLFT